MVDNGYDIADYRAINPVLGTMAVMDRLIAQRVFGHEASEDGSQHAN